MLAAESLQILCIFARVLFPTDSLAQIEQDSQIFTRNRVEIASHFWSENAQSEVDHNQAR
jgi:hypothetical protein